MSRHVKVFSLEQVMKACRLAVPHRRGDIDGYIITYIRRTLCKNHAIWCDYDIEYPIHGEEEYNYYKVSQQLRKLVEVRNILENVVIFCNCVDLIDPVQIGIHQRSLYVTFGKVL